MHENSKYEIRPNILLRSQLFEEDDKNFYTLIPSVFQNRKNIEARWRKTTIHLEVTNYEDQCLEEIGSNNEIIPWMIVRINSEKNQRQFLKHWDVPKLKNVSSYASTKTSNLIGTSVWLAHNSSSKKKKYSGIIDSDLCHLNLPNPKKIHESIRYNRRLFSIKCKNFREAEDAIGLYIWHSPSQTANQVMGIVVGIKGDRIVGQFLHPLLSRLSNDFNLQAAQLNTATDLTGIATDNATGYVNYWGDYEKRSSFSRNIEH